MSDVSKEDLLKFLKTQKGGVISTISPDNYPDSSFIYYAFNEDLYAYFITSKMTEKYKNIKSNPYVSFVVVDEENLITVQGKGQAKEVKDEMESQRVYDLLLQILHSKLENWPPPFSKMADADLVIMKITFTSLRLGDFRYSGTAPMKEFYSRVI